MICAQVLESLNMRHGGYCSRFVDDLRRCGLESAMPVSSCSKDARSSVQRQGGGKIRAIMQWRSVEIRTNFRLEELYF